MPTLRLILTGGASSGCCGGQVLFGVEFELFEEDAVAGDLAL